MTDSVLLDNEERIFIHRKTYDQFPPLRYLPKGILQLTNLFRDAERDVLTDPKKLDGMPWGLLTCYSFWLSVSIVSYGTIVSQLAMMTEKRWDSKDVVGNREAIRTLKIARTEYLERVSPAILEYRNKFGAHLAFSDLYPDDTMATIAQTRFIPISWEKDHFYINGIEWHSDGEGSNFTRWAINPELEKVASRWWPAVELHTLS